MLQCSFKSGTCPCPNRVTVRKALHAQSTACACGGYMSHTSRPYRCLYGFRDVASWFLFTFLALWASGLLGFSDYFVLGLPGSLICFTSFVAVVLLAFEPLGCLAVFLFTSWPALSSRQTKRLLCPPNQLGCWEGLLFEHSPKNFLLGGLAKLGGEGSRTNYSCSWVSCMCRAVLCDS